MPTQRPLGYFDPAASRGPLYRLNARLASSRFATWLATTPIWSTVVWRLDPLLLRLTRGRLGTGLLLPTALLETLGARTGQPRSNAVIYFHDGQKVTVVASKAGRPGNPSWFYNARTNPDVKLGGECFHAEIVEDPAELARLWTLADLVFPAFATYRRTAELTGRTIPVLQLVPRGG
jgi:deazaflavin-dependent oxidoreductase (nitroreductase family)